MALKDFEKRNNLTIPAGWWKNRQPGKFFNFRIAGPNDISALANLYTVCFGDDKSEAELFLRIFFQSSGARLLIAENKKIPVSMLAMVPARLSKGSHTFSDCFYLYGIGTLPPFRRQGLSSALIHLAKTLAASLSYDYLFLVPADKSLIPFYEKQGFFTRYPIPKQNTKKPPQTPSGSIWPHPSAPFAVSSPSDFAPISLAEYLALRANLETKSGVFSLQEPFSAYALEILKEGLHFYKDLRTSNGLCFYDNQKEPCCIFLEQTESSSPISGGLLHQIFPLQRRPIPDTTYFQFPMDKLDI